MEDDDGTSKIVLLDAKMYVMTKKVSPELILAQKEMLGETNMRFQMNRVIMQRYDIAHRIPVDWSSHLAFQASYRSASSCICVKRLPSPATRPEPIQLYAL